MAVPPKKEYPDYYKLIKRPISFDIIFVSTSRVFTWLTLIFPLYAAEEPQAQGLQYLSGLCRGRRARFQQCLPVQRRPVFDLSGCEDFTS